MIEDELRELIEKVRRRGCEGQTMEIKSAHEGCPAKLYDTLSAFANQNDGGVLLFGLDEKAHFAKVGVYNAQDLKKKVAEYGEQMTPVVRPVFTVYDEGGKTFVSAEIPPVDVAERPCFHTASGRVRGSFSRVGEADKHMTEYEVYSYEAFRQKVRDDLRPVEGASLDALDQNKLDEYMALMRSERPNLAHIPEAQQYELNGIVREGRVTMTALLLFGLVPQAFYPRLCISATCVPGTDKGAVDASGNRFTDTKRLEGTLPEMLTKALDFVRRNMRTATKINPQTGKRIDQPQYPMEAVREAVLNALVHRDYSVHTENMPIRLYMYEDRLEIVNPGGLYGRLTLDQLGHSQPDTRNPVLVTAMETLHLTENRYSGIPTIRRAMEEYHLPEPTFRNSAGEFRIILSNAASTATPSLSQVKKQLSAAANAKNLVDFCRVPRTRAEIRAYLGIASAQYALQRYLEPLVRSGAIRMTIPDKPRSHRQQFIAADSLQE